MTALRRQLELAHAPIALIDWIASIDDDVDEAWDGCDKGDWTVWMAACIGLSLDDVLDATYRAVRYALQELPEPAGKKLHEALRAMATRNEDDLGAAIAICERLKDPAAATYRSAPLPAGSVAAARAALHLGRALEALDSALAGDHAMRENEAVFAAGIVGVAPAIMTRPQGTPILVPTAIDREPIQEDLAFAVASSAEAVKYAARAMTGDDTDMEEAEGELSDLMHEVLSPLRDDANLFAFVRD